MKYDFSNNTIETERLLLREYTLDDVDKVVEYCNDPDMSRYMLHIPYPYKREDAINWINSHREYVEKDRLFNYAITDKDTGELLGTVSLSHNKENRNGEIGYWIGKKYWNKGYATEACKAIIQYAFEVKDYHKVYIRHLEENYASKKVIEKCGFLFEGNLKEHIYKNGKFHNILTYGLINRDFSS